MADLSKSQRGLDLSQLEIIGHAVNFRQWRGLMSNFTVLYLGGSICAFIVLAVLLAWDEYRARHLPH